ncbi:MAG: hypothetical protein KDA25_10585, partial [Phycisphaerales bacterium]|nr:hypothetical protein [Phycisphaerales bacterium]
MFNDLGQQIVLTGCARRRVFDIIDKMASRSKSLDARRAGARRTAAPPVAARGDGSGAGIAGPPPDFDIGARLRAVRR